MFNLMKTWLYWAKKHLLGSSRYTYFSPAASFYLYNSFLLLIDWKRLRIPFSLLQSTPAVICWMTFVPLPVRFPFVFFPWLILIPTDAQTVNFPSVDSNKCHLVLLCSHISVKRWHTRIPHTAYTTWLVRVLALSHERFSWRPLMAPSAWTAVTLGFK